MAEEHTSVVFSQMVATTGTEAVAYSSPEFASLLGTFDQIALSVTAEQISGSNPKITVELEHSADAIRWIYGPVNPLVDHKNLDASLTNVFVGFSDGSKPLLRFVRLKVTLESLVADINSYVRIDATLNDSRESQFSRKVRDLIEEAESMECTQMIQGGSQLGSEVAYRDYRDDGVYLDARALPRTSQYNGSVEQFLMDNESSLPAGIVNHEEVYGADVSEPGDTGTMELVTLDPSASICVNPDGTIRVSKAGQGSVTVAPAGTGMGGGSSASGMSDTGSGC